jgi:molybdopterin-containing oxidoreductase family membrane subunit
MLDYLHFWMRMTKVAFTGGGRYWLWITSLAIGVVVGVAAWAHQIINGLVVTNMSDQVSWGAYIANFTFLVGVAAGAVLFVVPAYALRDKNVKQVVLFGELLAVASIVMCLAFVTVDLGRPDRALHLLPYLGKLNFPQSILAWDVVVLNGYLLLNLHIPGYLMWKRYTGGTPDPRKYLPFVFLSMFWAVSIHTVTAFLYSGLGSRPFWNSAILAPRFLISAFVAGPGFLLIAMLIIDRWGGFEVPAGVFRWLVRVVRVTLPVNLFLFGSEVFTEFYTGATHSAAAHYLFFGLEGANMLVPATWFSLALSVFALFAFYRRNIVGETTLLVAASAALAIGVWVEKGMGLLIPGFVPSPLGEIVEYLPSTTETLVCFGIYCLGALVYTLFVKVAIAIQRGDLRRDA